MADDLPAPTLQTLVDSPSLQWIFVGGKGGVGKTTSSCSLAVQLASTPIKDAETGEMRPRRVLLISTDPAHNLSDAFTQKFGRAPTQVTGVEGLEAMEIDPQGIKEMTQSLIDRLGGGGGVDEGMAGAIGALKEAFLALPGIDEVSVLIHIMEEVKKLRYDVTVFDTAPTGHTLRLLSLPQTLNGTIERLQSVAGIGGLLSQAGAVVSSSTGMSSAELSQATKSFVDTVKQVQAQFQDNNLTTFVPVCIPEFLPVYETERLVQELCKYNIDVQSIIVNQVILTPPDEAPHPLLESRKRIQKKYLEQVEELYEDFHVVRMPLITNEVRGVEMLRTYGKYLLTPYNVAEVGYL
eukprot:TRINITY_DN12318_c2_g1_i1.p1 TRINITY_DN12318_c2_g1~~TRINITY_DN12318_c2_g1_i1.p1  ORF type:complete len:351 (+),score=169.41 TRINITY_DN12318_c2_g1_i1:64-1116(+)